MSDRIDVQQSDLAMQHHLLEEDFLSVPDHMRTTGEDRAQLIEEQGRQRRQNILQQLAAVAIVVDNAL